MGRKLYARKANGRFQRPTLENMLGLSAPPCPSCGRLNPHGVTEPPPESCHACGAAMRPADEGGEAARVADGLAAEATHEAGGSGPRGASMNHGASYSNGPGGPRWLLPGLRPYTIWDFMEWRPYE